MKSESAASTEKKSVEPEVKADSDKPISMSETRSLRGLSPHKGASPVSVGDEVFYVPEEIHAGDLDAKGVPVWEWRVESKKETRPATAVEVNSRVSQSQNSRGFPRREVKAKDAGFLTRGDNLVLKPDKPGPPWPAIITALDGETASLDISHPHGHVLHYDGRGRDENKTPGTWHAKEE
jgi:hypothetical protein